MKYIKSNLLVASLIVSSLTGCGGGGGNGGSPSPTVSQPVTPTSVAVQSSSSSIVVSSSSSSSSSIVKKDPLPIYKTSYENRTEANFIVNSFDIFDGPLSVAHKSGLLKSSERVGLAWAGSAVADFTRTGEYSVIANTIRGEYDTNGSQLNGQIIAVDKTGKDISSDLITGDRTGCKCPRKTLVADFNNDGMPDVFFACHGEDVAYANAPGEYSRIVLSNSTTGKYQVSTVSDTKDGYTHGASAADIDGDGNIDIVLADKSYANKTVSLRILMGTGDGNFINDDTRIDMLKLLDGRDPTSAAFYTVELIPSNSKLYMYAGGTDNAGFETDKNSSALVPTVEAEFKSGYVDYTSVKVLPGIKDTIALDIVKDANDDLYILRSPTSYTGMSIQKIKSDRSTSEIVYTNTGKLNTSRTDIGIPFFEVLNNELFGLDALIDFDLTM